MDRTSKKHLPFPLSQVKFTPSAHTLDRIHSRLHIGVPCGKQVAGRSFVFCAKRTVGLVLAGLPYRKEQERIKRLATTSKNYTSKNYILGAKQCAMAHHSANSSVTLPFGGVIGLATCNGDPMSKKGDEVLKPAFRQNCHRDILNRSYLPDRLRLPGQQPNQC